MKRLPLAILIGFLISAVRGHAIGIRLWPQDPEAVSLGSAFTATADTAAAIPYNPAGITQVSGQSLMLSSYTILYQVRFQGANGTVADTPDKPRESAQIYYAMPLKGLPLTFGIGVYEPYGLGSTWSDHSVLRSLATNNSLIYVSVNPVLAWKISKHLSVGAGLRLDTAQIDLRRGLLVPGDLFRFSGDGTTVGWNAGILWQPHRKHSFGFNYFSETSVGFHGNATVVSETPFLFPSTRESGSVKFRFPQHAVFGYSYRPTEDWNLEFDLDWTDWDQFGTSTLTKASGDVALPFNWRSGFTWQFGVKRRISDRFSIGAGYIFAPKNTTDATFTPAIPDMDLHTFSLGCVWQRERWRLAVTYQFAYGERTVTGSPPSAIGQSADGHYRWISSAVMLGLGLKF